jgi:hypothetical protein
MTQKRESRRQRRIRRALEREFPGSKWFKVHGNVFTENGLPDLIGAVEGFFFGFEIKEFDGSLSTIQIEQIIEYQEGGNCACAIETAEEAILIVRSVVAASKARRRGSAFARWLRSIVRTAYWKDVDRWGGDRKKAYTRYRGRLLEDQHPQALGSLHQRAPSRLRRGARLGKLSRSSR